MADLALTESVNQVASEAEAATECAVDEAVRETEELIDDAASIQKLDLLDSIFCFLLTIEIFTQLFSLSDFLKGICAYIRRWFANGLLLVPIFQKRDSILSTQELRNILSLFKKF